MAAYGEGAYGEGVYGEGEAASGTGVQGTAALTGAGSLTGVGKPGVQRTAALSGVGSLVGAAASGTVVGSVTFPVTVTTTVTGTVVATTNFPVTVTTAITGAAQQIIGTAAFVLDVATTVAGTRLEQHNAVVAAVESVLYQAPTVVSFTVAGGWPNDDVQIDVDGTVLLTTVLNSDGGLTATSVAIDATLGTAGTHTLTVTSLTGDPGYTTSFTFTIEIAPPPDAIPPGTDADPVIVPGADTGTGVYRWVLQDLAPSGIGSYVFPQNPVSMTSPHGARLLQQAHTTSPTSGQFHISEPGAVAQEWQFAGVCLTQAFYDKLVEFYELPRRFYLIDHRNRAWKVAFTSLDFKARLRTNVSGTLTDWVHDYTVSALIFDTNWSVPQ